MDILKQSTNLGNNNEIASFPFQKENLGNNNHQLLHEKLLQKRDVE